MTVDPRTAVVTASDSGIGRAVAVALAEAGMDIGITWHSDSEGAELTAKEVRELGRRVEVAHPDSTDLEACGDVVDQLAERLGGPDVFVNNAGTGDSAPFLDMTLDQWKRGEIATPMTNQTDEDPHAVHRPGVPVGRPGDAREIAAVVAILASPAASYVNGASWPVDGGMLLMGPQAGSHITSDDWRSG